ncbi:MAG: hypothetical protein KatS3mg011_0026 [Acidimicrobiia bacterium]|nr:MAG: hypothetical protein KatS3mg011_0026 [Acidimicrobiia bacterium]
MRVLSAVLVVASILFGAPSAWAEHPGDSPVEAYKDDLIEAGYRNGRMPEFRLLDVGGCVLEREAAYALSMMIEAALADGVELEPGWCYRTLEQQRAAYERNCPVETVTRLRLDPKTGLPLTDDEGRPLTTTWTMRVCRVPTASPSTSNHGWGRAVDFVYRGRALDCGDPPFRWLQENAWEFGWVHPLWAWCNRPTAEPWHWEWDGTHVQADLAPPSVEAPSNAE